MSEVVGAAGLAALTVLLCGWWGIPQLRHARLQQRIRDEAPERHRGKAGTPTMGGVFILFAILAATLLVHPWLTSKVGMILLVMIGYGAVGAIDDVLALRRGRNLGLRARERLAVQVPLAVLVALYVVRHTGEGSSLALPWIGRIDLGWFYLPFAVAYLVGFTNGVNLADGLDGLASGTVAIAAGAYAIIAMRHGAPDLATVAGAIAGACLGFVWFNAHPAAVFMGDVGSNALGAMLATLALLTKTEFLLFLVGVVFVLEAASVLLQVVYFKVTHGRRLFRMSPLHHHFELVGWTETHTVTRMWLVAAAGAVVGLALRF